MPRALDAIQVEKCCAHIEIPAVSATAICHAVDVPATDLGAPAHQNAYRIVTTCPQAVVSLCTLLRLSLQRYDQDWATSRELDIVHLVLTIDTTKKKTLQRQIYEQIRALIVEGRLCTGDRLPAIRELSAQLNIARNTVAIAYDLLAAEGYVEGEPSIGTFVSSQIPFHVDTVSGSVGQRGSDPDSGPAKRAAPAGFQPHRPLTPVLVNPHHNRLDIDFWAGRPDPTLFPIKVWRGLMESRLQSSWADISNYGDPCGLPELRCEIATHLRASRGIAVTADQIIIVGGCQDGLNLVARLLIKPASVVVVETPCYQGAAYLFESFEANLFPVPLDGEGLCTSQLPDTTNAIAYVTPSHQYPMGVTLSHERRLELLQWAVDTNSYVVEDDYDSDFRFHGSPLTAMKGLDSAGRVIYIGTFSKCIGAGLRLGFVILPRALLEHGRRIKALMNNGHAWLEQAVLADFMATGQYEKHLRRIRKVYLERRDVLVECLRTSFSASEILGEEAGIHLTWRLPDDLPDAAEVEALALSLGIGVYTLSSGASVQLGPNRASDRYLVLRFAALSQAQIREGIGLLRDELMSRKSAGKR